MCRWGCTTHDTTYMCKWCGTRFCRSCKKGEFHGEMKNETTCRSCFQPRCQGPRVEYIVNLHPPNDDNTKKTKKTKSATSSNRSKSKKKKSAKRKQK